MNDKLRVLVRLDLDCGQAEVAAQGHVTARSLQALYVVVKRANHLREGLRLVVDVSHARVEPAAMEQLQACSESHHLPAAIDPMQSECRLSIVAPVDAFDAGADAEAPVGAGTPGRICAGSRSAVRARAAVRAREALRLAA
ncbi:hypothetical protein [Arthrobacter sp. UYEF20]|uniref:hypothetical protein n=1 Tax=Arthrobacter sp. UYEF20 TaxID=1756363 RepID=UPI00339B80BF